jgi:hypothetical protein
VRGASLALGEVSLHGNDFFPWKKVIHERDVIISKAATVHRR